VSLRLTLPALLALWYLAPLESAAQALAHYDLSGKPAWRAPLPLDLAEISGIAFAPDGPLLAHGDEQAMIWQFDLRTRQLEGRFAFVGAGGILRGDFEDIQVVGERVFLVTSNAVIYEGNIAPDGKTAESHARTKGLGGGCEVEGMSWDEPTRSLLLLCKTTRSKQWSDRVVVVAVSVDDWRFEPEPRILIKESHLEKFTGQKRFNGSAIVRHPRTGTYLLVAGPQCAFAEVSPAGEVLGGGILHKSLHRQPEGLAIAPDLTLLVSDEAAGGEASITGYAFRP
jgi:hypothetical protein